MAELNYMTLREQMVHILRDRILDGTIQPGEKIKEVDISKEFNISRGPVREALRQIEQEGLVQYEANRGCTVRELTYDSMNEMYLIRVALEKLAVEIIDGKYSEETLRRMEEEISELDNAVKHQMLSEIVKHDEEFHSLIVTEAKSDRLYRIWKSFEGENAAAYYTMQRNELMPTDHIKRNHQWILDACREGDCQKICEVINEHYVIVPETLYKNRKDKI